MRTAVTVLATAALAVTLPLGLATTAAADDEPGVNWSASADWSGHPGNDTGGNYLGATANFEGTAQFPDEGPVGNRG
ncbi:hypothetical protein ACPXCE_27905 [Streptomyces sp. DT24]|uniref:hypothetical protein n=1 Tax=Streptomyces sp. DT24 TaxID=3416520 RepID=UPI003CEA3C38